MHLAFVLTILITALVVWQRHRLPAPHLLLQLCLAGALYTYVYWFTNNPQASWEPVAYLWVIFLLIQFALVRGVNSLWLLIINTLFFYGLYKVTQPTLQPSGLLALLVAVLHFISYRYHKAPSTLLSKGFLSLCLLFTLLGSSNLIYQTSPNVPDKPVISTVENTKYPLIYSPHYNITIYGIEKLHPYDSEKYGKVYNGLLKAGLFKPEEIVTPSLPSMETLQRVHTPTYLKNLKTAGTLGRVSEIPFLALFPDISVHENIGVPMLYATQGSVLAGELALKHGWAINLGGGYHHASATRGGGFCAYADITLSIRELQKNHPEIKKVMIIDLDAHQGNGHERDFINDENIFIVDLYNPHVYPHDEEAKQGIDLKRELPEFTNDTGYLSILDDALDEAFQKFKPDIIYYIAGSDILENDPLGRLSVSPKGIIQRDQRVFEVSRKHNVPVVMLLAGGYQQNNAQIITDSIQNLSQQFSLFQ